MNAAYPMQQDNNRHKTQFLYLVLGNVGATDMLNKQQHTKNLVLVVQAPHIPAIIFSNTSVRQMLSFLITYFQIHQKFPEYLLFAELAQMHRVVD